MNEERHVARPEVGPAQAEGDRGRAVGAELERDGPASQPLQGRPAPGLEHAERDPGRRGSLLHGGAEHGPARRRVGEAAALADVLEPHLVGPARDPAGPRVAAPADP
jgi:hypothetical protein